MPEQDSPFPDSFALNGVDYFCLQLDGLIRRSSGKHNVCTFVVNLADRLTLEDLHCRLNQRPAYQWLCRLRLNRGLPFSLPKWIFSAKAEMPAINQYQLANANSSLDSLLSTDLDIENQSPFKIDLLQFAGAGSALLFTWHHVLMDAHGGEAFIRYLGMNLQLQPQDWVSKSDDKLPLTLRANIALRMKDFLYEISSAPLLSLYKKNTSKPQPRYCVMRFTPSQTLRINERARQMGAGFLLSAFYLAAIATALTQVRKQRSTDLGDILAPVPLDRRKRGAHVPVLGNQVSFLFYRIPNAVLVDLKACTVELISQMKTLMRSESPEHYTIMVDFLRRVPNCLYRLLVKSPTDGLMASFFYSDTGDSLQNFAELFGQTVISATHYPPNMYPPGMTFVFSRFQNALQITIAYMEADLNPFELELLQTQLHSALSGETEG